MVPIIYECPECKEMITFASQGRVKFARKVNCYSKKDHMFSMESIIHKCRITRDGKMNNGNERNNK